MQYENAPIHFAALGGKSEMIKYLKRVEADLLKINKVSSLNSKYGPFCCRCNISIRARDILQLGATALHYAAGADNHEFPVPIVDESLEVGATDQRIRSLKALISDCEISPNLRCTLCMVSLVVCSSQRLC